MPSWGTLFSLPISPASVHMHSLRIYWATTEFKPWITRMIHIPCPCNTRQREISDRFVCWAKCCEWPKGRAMNQWEWAVSREVVPELDFNRCGGGGQAEEGRQVSQVQEIAEPFFLPLHWHPHPLLLSLQHPCSEIIQYPWGKRNKCSTLHHAKHTPPVLVPVKCISHLICSLNEMWKQFTPRLHLCCFTKQHRYSSIQSNEMRSVTPFSPWIESTKLFRSFPGSSGSQATRNLLSVGREGVRLRGVGSHWCSVPCRWGKWPFFQVNNLQFL